MKRVDSGNLIRKRTKEGSHEMQCLIEKFERPSVHSFGASKEIVVEEFEWSNHGETGKTYTYRMSPERFERNNKTAYHIIIEDDEGIRHTVSTMSYYDFVDYNIEDCIGDRLIEQLAKKMGIPSEKIWSVIEDDLQDLQQKIRDEFSQTEEYQVSKKNQEIIATYERNKKRFCMELGVDAAKYDRCYNVFGELMDGEYLSKIHQTVEDRKKFSENSRRKHKEAWRNFSGSSDFFSSKSNYCEEDKEMLSRFYKVLAKKFHPDANPGVDTSKEMQLLNQIKKDWGV